MTDRIWLDVPYADKDAAKAAGARWDPDARQWYAGPRADMHALARWIARPPLPDPLPGEDRTFGDRLSAEEHPPDGWPYPLYVDLIPSSCWFTNARSCVSPADWERLRRMVTGRVGGRCEVCGHTPAETAQMLRGVAKVGREMGEAVPDPDPVYLEVHERWRYWDHQHVQQLRRLVCLCTCCHEVTHFGLTTERGRDAEAYAHLRGVTNCSVAAAVRHIDGAFALWQDRSIWTWHLDLSILTNAGIEITPPANDRRAAAARELHQREGVR